MAETKYAGLDTETCPSSTVSAQLKGYGSGYCPTPFWCMGFYLGGCCSQGSGYGTTSYNYLTKQGWNLVPIWVSVQNYVCSTGKCSVPSTSSGISSAQSASKKATAVGFPTGTVIYLGIEVTSSPSTPSAALSQVGSTRWIRTRLTLRESTPDQDGLLPSKQRSTMRMPAR